MLVEHLPPDSAVIHSSLGEKAAWGVSEQLLAQVIHRLDLARYQSAGGKKAGKAPQPIPTPWTRQTGPTPAHIVARLRDFADRTAHRRKARGGIDGD